MITYVLPTRDRPAALAATLAALGGLAPHAAVGGAEVIVVDNASKTPAAAPARLANGLPVRVIRRDTNEGAASRNAGVAAADPRSGWIVMLDDDSHPLDTGFIVRLLTAPADVAAVSADILLPRTRRREMGGLPEVFVGCGAAIRRSAYERAGGYDSGFGYYAEEYDLAARLIAGGGRVAFDRWFRVEHHKDPAGRDMNLIVARLVRNNGWVIQRYAPDHCRRAALRESRARCRVIARRENALAGYARGLAELRATIRLQRRTPLPAPLWERFTGLAHAREAIARAYDDRPFATAEIVDEGKNGSVVRRVLRELGVRVVDSDAPDALVIGTMSPGPMLDSFEQRTARPGPRVIAPWIPVAEMGTEPFAAVLTGRSRRASA